jgi:hypothetical protein
VETLSLKALLEALRKALKQRTKTQHNKPYPTLVVLVVMVAVLWVLR